jgi:hypothetical protein
MKGGVGMINIKTKKLRSTRKMQSPINRGLKVTSRKNRYSKFCDVAKFIIRMALSNIS